LPDPGRASTFGRDRGGETGVAGFKGTETYI